ncbi:MAG: hypothetical protein KBT12_01490 [Bacteroidales bacterium]|nr:hypothetical protein [Candidatus Physcousia equi]
MPHTKEEALRLGIQIQPIKHNKKRRAVWHDYTRMGTYLLTIHICTDDEGRCYEGMLLSHIVGDPMAEADTEAYPHPELTELGRMVDYKIDAISSYPQFGDVEVKARTIMPTHIHLIVEVKRDLPYCASRKRTYHLGDLVRGFKQGCTSLFKRWMRGRARMPFWILFPSLTEVRGMRQARGSHAPTLPHLAARRTLRCGRTNTTTVCLSTTRQNEPHTSMWKRMPGTGRWKRSTRSSLSTCCI